MFRIGEYIIYPAFILLLLIVIFIATVFFVVFIKYQKKSSLRKKYQITPWQKAELPCTFDYVKNEIDNEEARQYYAANESIIEEFKNYIVLNKFWDYNQILEISPNAPYVISKIIFYDIESSLKDCDDGEERALLLSIAFDMINGGPIYENKECIWMEEDIEEVPDSGVSPTERKLKTLYNTALSKIVEQMGEEDNYINEALDVPYYIKKYSKEDIFAAIGDLLEKSGVNHIDVTTRAALIDAILFVVNSYFLIDDDYVDDITVCYIRCLSCVLTNKMYDIILNSI